MRAAQRINEVARREAGVAGGGDGDAAIAPQLDESDVVARNHVHHRAGIDAAIGGLGGDRLRGGKLGNLAGEGSKALIAARALVAQGREGRAELWCCGSILGEAGMRGNFALLGSTSSSPASWMASTILSLSGASSQPGSRGVEEVLIRLSTPFAAYRVPSAALSVPADLNRNGLSAVVHHLMGIDAGSSAAAGA